MRVVYQRANMVMVNCLNTGTLVAQCGVDQERIQVVNPGIDSKWLNNGKQFESMSEKASDESISPPEILTVGRLVPHKGHATIMESLPAP